MNDEYLYCDICGKELLPSEAFFKVFRGEKADDVIGFDVHMFILCSCADCVRKYGGGSGEHEKTNRTRR